MVPLRANVRQAAVRDILFAVSEGSTLTERTVQEPWTTAMAVTQVAVDILLSTVVCVLLNKQQSVFKRFYSLQYQQDSREADSVIYTAPAL